MSNSKQISGERVLLDDGEFYVVLDPEHEPANAAGYLQRRCQVSPLAPAGFECMGAFTRRADGRWETTIAKVFDPRDDGDCTLVGSSPERKDAIFMLWKARQAACVGYHTLRTWNH